MKYFSSILAIGALAVLFISKESTQAQQVPTSREQIQLSFSPVVKKAAPAVVNIYTKRKVVDRSLSPFMNDPFFSQFFGNRFGAFGQPRERIVSSLGSGVIVSVEGTMVTNYHVIKGAQDITVVLSDKREMAAEIMATDEQSDLAILSIQTKGERLPYLQLHDSDSISVGDLVLAIGNPFGVGQTVTSGIISALARSAKTQSDFSFFIQTDAAINPGNSGGALVDLQGRLIGVPTAIYTRSGGSNGIGFAIPANLVQALLSGEKKNGKIVKPWLGASYQDVTVKVADSLGLDKPGGVLIANVFDGGPADRAGLKSGDVIIRFDGQEIQNTQALRFRTAIAEIGEPTEIIVLRGGRERKERVKLTTPPDRPARDERTLSNNTPFNALTVANLNPALAIELGMNPTDKGVVVTKPHRSAKVGDIIRSINGKKMESTKQLDSTLKQTVGGWRIQIQRGGQLINMTVMK